jgi:lipoprotein-anchoring transpeptidase ErfK/SrfK
LKSSMRKRVLIVLLLAALWAVIATAAQAQQTSSRSSIEIDLQEQMAHLVEDGYVVLSTPISSGRIGHESTRGTFKITQKERNHLSNLYGKIVDARGNTIVADADADMPVPRGGRFVPAAMPYFMRYNGAEGMHAGGLPGYPASHGCVRLPKQNAIAIFEAVEIGTPVTVFGTTPRGRLRRSTDGFTQRSRRDVPTPRYDARFYDPYAPPVRWR